MRPGRSPGCILRPRPGRRPPCAPFIAPIEREDIAELAEGVDDVSHALSRIVRHLYMYDLAEVDENARQMLDRVQEQCTVMYEGMGYFREFKKPKRLKEKACEVNDLGKEVDERYLQAIRALFTGDVSPVELPKAQAVLTSIHVCSDAICRVAGIMKRLALKNG